MQRLETTMAHLGMAQRHEHLGNSLFVGSLFRVTVEIHNRHTILVGQNLNIGHGGTCTLGLDTKRFEYGFFACPTSCKRCFGVGLSTAVSNLGIGKVALDECWVVGRN